MYKQNEDMRFENLGVITDQRIPVCQVYYPEKKLIPNPYTFSRQKRVKAITCSNPYKRKNGTL